MDHGTRMKYIRKRISKYRSRKEMQLIGCISAVCLALAGGIGCMLHAEHQPGMFTIQTEYGAVLLHNGGEPYVVVSVIAFIGGAAFTIFCIKLNQRKHRSREKEENTTYD